MSSPNELQQQLEHQQRLLRFQKIQTNMLRLLSPAVELMAELRDADKAGWSPDQQHNATMVLEQLQNLEHFILSFTYQDLNDRPWK